MECVRNQMRKLAHLKFYPLSALLLLAWLVTLSRARGGIVLVERVQEFLILEIYVFHGMGVTDGARLGFLLTRDVQ